MARLEFSANCSAPGCDRRVRSAKSGLCEAHYYRLRRGSSAGLAPLAKDCANCGKPLVRNQSKYCSHKCGTRLERGTPNRRSCSVCGSEFETQGKLLVCSAECLGARSRQWDATCAATPERKDKRRHDEYRRKARRMAAPVEEFEREEIFERDAWRCGLCGGKLSRNARWPHPRFPTIDHIIPFAAGGSHTRINVQAAHLSCNSAKSDRTMGQLRLFG